MGHYGANNLATLPAACFDDSEIACIRALSVVLGFPHHMIFPKPSGYYGSVAFFLDFSVARFPCLRPSALSNVRESLALKGY